MNFNKGFTIVELIVIVGITTILAALILFSITIYINKARDVNVLGNLSVLLPAGEDYYANNNNSYEGFCDSKILTNAFLQMPKHPEVVNCSTDQQHAGLCCNEGKNVWASCFQEFTKPRFAYCVDSGGVKKEICNESCNGQIYSCPEDDLSLCQD